MIDDIAAREVAMNADPDPKRNEWTRFVLSSWAMPSSKRERNADTW